MKSKVSEIAVQEPAQNIDDLALLLAHEPAEIAKAFTYMTDDHLQVLLTFERDGANRADLIAAIEQEAGARAANGNAADGNAAMVQTQDDLDRIIAAEREGHAAEIAALVAEHEKALAAAIKAANKAAKPAKIERPKALDLVPTALTAAEVAGAGATQIVLVDMDGVPASGITPLAFGPADYAVNSSTGAALLLAAIDLPNDMPHQSLSAAYLLDEKGQPVSYAALITRFDVGGGLAGLLPSGTLQFELRIAA
jgi:hypothetical protein